MLILSILRLHPRFLDLEAYHFTQLAVELKLVALEVQAMAQLNVSG